MAYDKDMTRRGAMRPLDSSPEVGGAPVVTVPQGGAIAARPRREWLYDTYLYSFGGTENILPFFQGGPFTGSSPSPKNFGLDTNLVGPGGSIPRGHYLRVFGTCVYMTRRGVAATTAAMMNDKVRLWDMAYWTLLMGSTPYLNTQLNRIPSCTGLTGSLATTEAVVSGDLTMGWPTCTCYFDLTVPGRIRKQTVKGVREVRVPRIPIEFAETENFAVNITYPAGRPTITGSMFIESTLVSIYIKPLAA